MFPRFSNTSELHLQAPSAPVSCSEHANTYTIGRAFETSMRPLLSTLSFLCEDAGSEAITNERTFGLFSQAVKGLALFRNLPEVQVGAR